MMQKQYKPKKCKECDALFTPFNSMQKVCGVKCADSFGRKQNEIKAAKSWKKEKAERKKALRSRSDWYKLLQIEVNRYVLLRDKKKPCCTCGTTKPDIKYDAGHFITVGSRPELRFELTNIHKQCSVKCNQHGSGMRLEYARFIIGEYGDQHLDWLEGPHMTLKERFPHTDDIEKEIKRFRTLNRNLRKRNEIK